ncbi:hypothetical protein C7M84_025006 [Penaeus vannamei]|uniref:Uncharacterized protein n=1 Tax=Penaeus vannamei TaxID=6689 RepID=A0A3R7PZ94_PENVA|nr:hypothetical protein C7M84_025006 [Penaeus vannamei]
MANRWGPRVEPPIGKYGDQMGVKQQSPQKHSAYSAASSPRLPLALLAYAAEILNKAKSGCSSKRILWKKADGTTSNTPQIHVGACTLECHQGEDRYLKIKARRLEKKEQEKDNEHGYSSKNTRRFLKQPSKKQNCPAQINIKQVLLFPEFQVDDAKSEFKRKKKSKELKEALGSDSRLKVKVQFHVTLPDPVSGHEGHPVGNDAVACLRKIFDKQVGEKIRQLKAGVSKVPDLQRHLSLSADTVAKDEKLDVNILDQRFFPTEADLKNRTPRVDRRGKHVPKHAMPASRKNLVEQHVKSFPTVSSHYTRAKSPLMRYLDTDMTLKMFFLYKELVRHQRGRGSSLIGCPSSSFKPPNTDTCSKCDRYEVSKKDASTEEEAVRIQADWDDHLSFAKEGMKAMKKLQEDDDPNTRCICLDLQQTLPVHSLLFQKVLR